MKATGMCIHLDGLKFYARHGMLPQETKVGAEFSVDLCLFTDFSRAAEEDVLDGTLNYAEVFECVKFEMGISSKLLEHVSYRIAQHLLRDFPSLDKVIVRICKQNPPMGADSLRIGVEAVYTR